MTSVLLFKPQMFCARIITTLHRLNGESTIMKISSCVAFVRQVRRGARRLTNGRHEWTRPGRNNNTAAAR